MLVGLGFLPPLSQSAFASPGGDRERLVEAVRDMELKHEIRPHGIVIKAGWHIGPFIVMGAMPYGSAIPLWWRKGKRYAEWRSLAAWFTVYLEAGVPRASNTGVEVNGIESWALMDSSGHWAQLRSMRQPSWQGAFHPDAVQPLKMSGGRFLENEGFLALPTGDFMVHGGITQTMLPWTDRPDFRALLVSVRHRLRLIDPAGPDDRASAGFGVLAGADYYPWVGASLKDLEADYNPGAGSGRFKRVSQEWRYSTVLLINELSSSSGILNGPPPSFSY